MSGWWNFTRSTIEALTAPIDIHAADQAVRDLASHSRIGAALHKASWLARRAWAASHVRTALLTLSSVLAPESVVTIRLAGWIAVVAGAAALVLYALKPVPIGPLSWLVPTLVVVGGALTMVMAAPLSRAVADRRNRDLRQVSSR